MKKEKTLGQVCDENLLKEAPDASYKEMADETAQTLPVAMQKAFEKGKHHFGKDFYIEILMRIHKHLNKVYHPQLYVRRTCPRPMCSQTVLKCNGDDGTYDILWAVPPKAATNMYLRGEVLVGPEEDQNLRWVVEYSTGVLDKKFEIIREEDNARIRKESYDTDGVIKRELARVAVGEGITKGGDSKSGGVKGSSSTGGRGIKRKPRKRKGDASRKRAS